MIPHPGPSGSPSFLGPPPGHMGGPMGGVGMPPPGLTPPMDPGSLTPDHSVMPPPMSMTPNGPMMTMYGPNGLAFTNSGPLPMTGPSPSSLSPQQMDGRLSGPPPQMPPHPGLPSHFAPRRISFPPVDFKIYEMCRKLQQKPENCDNIWWDQFVSDFFEDDATYSLNFCLEDGPKRYSFGRHLIPRYFRTMFDSGIAQLWYILRNPKQDVMPTGGAAGGVTIILDCGNTLMCTYHAKPSAAHVATEGKLCVEFAASPGGDFGSMRVRHWTFTLGASHEYLLRQDLQAVTRNPSNPNSNEQLNGLCKNITRCGLTNNILNYLRLCVILEPMQELMSRHKIYGASPRDCLKNTLFERFQRNMAPHGPHSQPIIPGCPMSHESPAPINAVSESSSRSNSKSRRKRKTSSGAGGDRGANSNQSPGSGNGSNSSQQNNTGSTEGGTGSSGGGGGSGGGSGKKSKNNSNSSTNNSNTASQPFNPSNVDVLVVGEPSLMGGEFGDEDERKITRLENNSTTPALGGTAATNKVSNGSSNSSTSGTSANTCLPTSAAASSENNCNAPPPSPLQGSNSSNVNNSKASSKVTNGPSSPATSIASQLPNLNFSNKSTNDLAAPSLSTTSTAVSSQAPNPSSLNHSSPLVNGTFMPRPSNNNSSSPMACANGGPMPPANRSTPQPHPPSATVKLEPKSEAAQLSSITRASPSPASGLESSGGASRFQNVSSLHSTTNGHSVDSTIDQMSNNTFNNNLLPVSGPPGSMTGKHELKQTPSPKLPVNVRPSSQPPPPLLGPAHSMPNCNPNMTMSGVSTVDSFMPNHMPPPVSHAVNNLPDFNSFPDMKVPTHLSALHNSMEMKLGHQVGSHGPHFVPWRGGPMIPGGPHLMPPLGMGGPPMNRAQELMSSNAAAAMNANMASSFYSIHHK